MTPAGELHEEFVAGSTAMFRLGKNRTGRLSTDEIYDGFPAEPQPRRRYQTDNICNTLPVNPTLRNRATR
jgi:hypothetical protein